MESDADLTWKEGGAPYSRRFGDLYFSAEDGQAETREVFLAGNALPQRWQKGVDLHIAELGFGTGLNFLETLHLWQKQGQPAARLTFSSFELYPLTKEEMARALKSWPDLETAALLDQWPPAPDRPLIFGPVTLHLITGDARTTLPQWQDKADAWFLDGFSPARNPELWEAPLMQAVFDHTKPGGTFSTYTAAGFVRRNLQAAGFSVARVKGFGRKRERLQGFRATDRPASG